MLSLQLKSGDYLTIGDDIAVQIFQQSGSAFSVAVKAPREILILRGEVLERSGGKRPDCVQDGPRWHRQEVPWNRSKAQALQAMRKLLSEMDGSNGDVQAMRRQLNHIFPPAAKDEGAVTEVSNG